MGNIGFVLGRIVLFAVLAATWIGQAVAATAGVVQFVAGDVRITLVAGGEQSARKGSPISVGDTLATAKASMAQIKMGDGAIIVVQPESRLAVAEFRYAGKEDGTEKVVFRLEQGGFRSVTGTIGHTNKGNYLIETPIAYIGVRGTDHETYYFPTPGSGNGESARTGIYNKVNVGLTYIRTQSGEVAIGPNQVGYAASAQDVPRLLPAMPEFFNRGIEPRNARRGNPSDNVVRQLAVGGTTSLQVIQTVTTTDGINLSNPGGSQAGVPAGGGNVTLVGYTQLNGSGNTFSGVNLGISPNGATLANAGGDSAQGVNWGSWQGGLATVNGNATEGSTHFIQSTNLTSPAQLAALPPGLVSATYNYAGGPAPTNNQGTQGTVNSLTVGVNFSTQTITNYAVKTTIGTTTWNASGTGSIANFTGAPGISIAGNCSGCTGSGSPTANGSAHGAFVGSAAEKMITSFGLKSSGGEKMSGVGYLSR